jgi:hypothetical protein
LASPACSAFWVKASIAARNPCSSRAWQASYSAREITRAAAGATDCATSDRIVRLATAGRTIDVNTPLTFARS